MRITFIADRFATPRFAPTRSRSHGGGDDRIVVIVVILVMVATALERASEGEGGEECQQQKRPPSHGHLFKLNILASMPQSEI